MGKHDLDGVGYNDQECIQIDKGIENVYNTTVTSIQTHIEQDIVNEIAKEWYSEIAVDYMGTFKNNCSNASDDVRVVFQNFRDQIQSNITNWRERTGSTGRDLQDVSQKNIDINVNAIKATDTDGNRYISDTIEQNLPQWILTCKSNIIADIDLCIVDNAVGGFIGEEQNEKVNAAMATLSDIIAKILSFLDTGDNSILNAIAEYRRQYQQSGQKVADDSKNKDYGEGADTTGGSDDGTSSSQGGNQGGSSSGNQGGSSAGDQSGNSSGDEGESSGGNQGGGSSGSSGESNGGNSGGNNGNETTRLWFPDENSRRFFNF